MAKVFSEKAQEVLGFLQENTSVQLTAKELAQVLNIPAPSLNGVITSLATRGYIERVPATIGGVEIKYITLTPAGRDVDLEAEKK